MKRRSMSDCHFGNKLPGGLSNWVVLVVIWLSTINLPAQSNVVLELVGRWTNGFSKYATAIQVTNGIAYLGYDTLEIINVQEPSRPIWLSSYVPPDGGTIQQIDVVDGKAFLALSIGVEGSAQGGLDVVDVSQPSRPQRIGHSSEPVAAGGVRILDSYALVAGYYSGLSVLDISHPEAPVLLGQFGTGNPRCLDVAGNRAYLAGVFTMQVFDITSLPHARLVGSYSDWSTSFSRIRVNGLYAYLAAAGVQVIDTQSLALAGQFSSDAQVSDLAVSGSNLYLAAGAAGVMVLDLARPTQPQWIGGGATVGSAGGLVVNDGHAFVLSDQGLEVYQVANRPIGIVKQPRSQVFINNGQPLVLAADGISVLPLVYQWAKAGVALVDGGRVAGANGPVLTIRDVVPGDSGIYTLTVSNQFGAATSLGASVTYQAGLHEALDYPGLEWLGDWIWQTNVTHDGVDAAQGGPIRSGIIAAGTGISTRITGPGTLGFWWRVSATQDDSPFDDFRMSLYIGDQERAVTSEEAFRYTGPEFWQHVVAEVPPGNQTLVWLLQTLGGCTDTAEGRVWLDEVAFTPTGPYITKATRQPGNGCCQIECQAVPGTRLVLQRSTDLQAWDDFLGPNDVLPITGRTVFVAPESPTGIAFYRLRAINSPPTLRGVGPWSRSRPQGSWRSFSNE